MHKDAINNNTHPIDAVIPWVDGNDPAHQEKLREYVHSQGGAVEMPHPSFFREVGELDYCVKAILKYAPFTRYIFIVTDSQTPNIIKESEHWHTHYRQKIRIVDHTEIFKGFEDALPSFNPRSINALIHRIPGLANHCIYFDDDFILIKPTGPEHWFDNGVPVIRGRWTLFPDKVWYKRLKKKWVPKKNPRPRFKQGQVVGASLAGFNVRYFRCWHAPRPVRKSTIENFMMDHQDLLANQVQYRLRHASQFIPWSLACHLELKSKTAKTTRELGAMEFINPHKRSFRKLQRKLDKAHGKKEVFCVTLQSLDRVDEKKLNLFIDWLDRVTDFDFQVAPDTHK